MVLDTKKESNRSVLLNLPASSKFWELEQRIKLDKNKPGVILNLRKQQMLFDIVRLIHDGVITMEDLLDFSDDLREHVEFLLDMVTQD